jgi:hypothetical protein
LLVTGAFSECVSEAARPFHGCGPSARTSAPSSSADVPARVTTRARSRRRLQHRRSTANARSYSSATRRAGSTSCVSWLTFRNSPHAWMRW